MLRFMLHIIGVARIFSGGGHLSKILKTISQETCEKGIILVYFSTN